MGLATLSGNIPANVQHFGLNGLVSGNPITAAGINGDDQDLQAPEAYACLAGALTGGNCTASLLNVTIPNGTAYYAKTVWIANADVVIGVPDAATTYLWGCSDGVIRPTTTNTLPASFDALSACLLVKVVAAGGVATVDNTARQKGRYADPVARKVADGPLVLDYANAVVDTSGSALQIPAGTADPTVPGVGVFLWFRTDLGKLGVSVNGTVTHSGAFT